uniref:OCIA domain-containing protein n=1 Tax=Branchiostoma floridae TaxID=7739 RepID=C3Y3G6_BRAFL|eukprot:XP_002609223.1 hypothetical protein BRAFLDRAFT_90676 [Branchiostoma floridae]
MASNSLEHGGDAPVEGLPGRSGVLPGGPGVAVQGSGGKQLTVSPEEMQIFQQCRRESFFYRCLPLGGAFGIVTNRLLAAVAAIAGWVLGKWSYMRTCENKFLLLENSHIGDLIRKRRGMVPIGGMSSDYGSSSSFGQDSSGGFRDTEVEFSGPVEAFGPMSIPDDEQSKKYLTYEELRKRNRDASPPPVSSSSPPPPSFQPTYRIGRDGSRESIEERQSDTQYYGSSSSFGQDSSGGFRDTEVEFSGPVEGGRSQDEANIAIEDIKKSCTQAKAGVMLTPYSLTEDGFETHFGVNHLGHFLLTNLLLDTLRSSGKPDLWSRIVFVSSAVHSIGDINFDDLNSSKNYSPHAGYAQSKLANVLTAYELQRRLLADQSHVTANALHPGVVNSDLYQHVMWPMRVAQRIMGWIGLTKTTKQGADTILYAAMSPDLEGIGGRYLDNCQSVPSSDQSYDKDLQKRLWEESCRLVHLQE